MFEGQAWVKVWSFLPGMEEAILQLEYQWKGALLNEVIRIPLSSLSLTEVTCSEHGLSPLLTSQGSAGERCSDGDWESIQIL